MPTNPLMDEGQRIEPSVSVPIPTAERFAATAAPVPLEDPHVIAELLRSQPDALESKFRATYTSLLNLLDAFGSFKQVREIAERSFAFRNARRKEVIWRPFEHRAKVLDHFGYLDYKNETVTESGKWLADLRLDRPLLVGEALRQGLFDDIEPKTAAGLMASLASDPDRDYGNLHLADPLLDVVTSIEDIIYDISRVEWRCGVDPVEEINLSAAATAERWAGGMSWADLAKRTRADEGDLVRLLSRTGEALLQIAHLGKSDGFSRSEDGTRKRVTLTARETSELILREPVR